MRLKSELRRCKRLPNAGCLGTAYALQREQLHAYGLSAAHAVKVLQQTPMTVLQCEHVELAIEHAVTRHIWAEPA